MQRLQRAQDAYRNPIAGRARPDGACRRCVRSSDVADTIGLSLQGVGPFPALGPGVCRGDGRFEGGGFAGATAWVRGRGLRRGDGLGSRTGASPGRRRGFEDGGFAGATAWVRGRGLRRGNGLRSRTGASPRQWLLSEVREFAGGDIFRHAGGSRHPLHGRTNRHPPNRCLPLSKSPYFEQIALLRPISPGVCVHQPGAQAHRTNRPPPDK
jgi:hypothetical protein